MCPSAEGFLVQGDLPVTCEEARDAELYGRVIAARALTPTQRDHLRAALLAVAKEDPSALREALAEAKQTVTSLTALEGFQAAEARSRHVHGLAHGQGPFAGPGFVAIQDILDQAIAVWQRDDAESLVLTEMDVEGWIRYVSLAREVQGGGPMRLSVADRVMAYRTVTEAWADADRRGKVALCALGPFWPGIAARWKAVTYGRQQRWIRAAPLPPPMVATSLGYLEAVSLGDLHAHVAILHEQLGPFRIDDPG